MLVWLETGSGSGVQPDLFATEDPNTQGEDHGLWAFKGGRLFLLVRTILPCYISAIAYKNKKTTRATGGF